MVIEIEEPRCSRSRPGARRGRRGCRCIERAIARRDRAWSSPRDNYESTRRASRKNPPGRRRDEPREAPFVRQEAGVRVRNRRLPAPRPVRLGRLQGAVAFLRPNRLIAAASPFVSRPPSAWRPGGCPGRSSRGHCPGWRAVFGSPPQKAFVHRDDCKVLRTTWSAWLTF